MSFFLLLESSVGYALFEVVEHDQLGASSEAARNACDDLGLFSKAVKLTSFRPFTSAEEGLGQILAVSEGEVTDELVSFLQQNLPKLKITDKHRYLGVADQKLGSQLQEQLQVPCRWTDNVQELMRGVRTHLGHYIKTLSASDLEKARLSLGHSYSRSRIKFNVHRQDNMIIQAIQLLDQLDKDVNTNAMRCREWYGWHFPELSKIVTDSHIYAKLVKAIQNRRSLFELDEEATLEKLTAVTNDEDLARLVLTASHNSMGMDVSEIDMLNITMFAERVEALSAYRHDLHNYLAGKMEVVAPNLNALLGEALGARLIAHAGSLTKLSKCPASTVQILGAEKALFRALKSKGNTPKFGLLFNSSYISRAATKNKGRISRYLANKCAIASRIDAFSDAPNSAYGLGLKGQVEERLKFYEDGSTPAKNIDVMTKIKESMQAANAAGAADVDMSAEGGDDEAEHKRRKKELKKAKKKQRLSQEAAEPAEPAAVLEEADDGATGEKKKKKKTKRATE